MNRGHVLQSPLVQQMVAGNPNWWNINNMRPPSQQNSPFLPPLPPYFLSQYTSQPPPPPPSSSSSSSSLPFSPSWHDNNPNNHQEQLPESWSQLLLGGLVSEEEKSCLSEIDHQAKKLESWEEQLLSQQPPNGPSMEIKLEDSSNSSYLSAGGGHGNNNVWTQMIPNSSPKSCVTSLSTSMLDFSSKKADGKHPPPDHSSECNSSTGGALKKARVQPPPTQSTIKVRKEKLGDRITALHQIVSPFGKTDTASVLLEAIGYIRFLQSQIEALSLPYLGNTGPGNMRQQQHPVQGERSCLFPEDPGQVSHEEPKKDLRSRGLCLVPISCTMQVGSDNGADYWAPAIGGGFQ